MNVQVQAEQLLETFRPYFEEALKAVERPYLEQIKKLEEHGEKREIKLKSLTLENRALKSELEKVKMAYKEVWKQRNSTLQGVAQSIEHILTTTLAPRVPTQNARPPALLSYAMVTAAERRANPPDLIPRNGAPSVTAAAQGQQEQRQAPATVDNVGDNSNHAQPALLETFKQEPEDEDLEVTLPPELPPSLVRFAREMEATTSQGTQDKLLTMDLIKDENDLPNEEQPEEQPWYSDAGEFRSRNRSRYGLRLCPKPRQRGDFFESIPKRRRIRTRAKPKPVDEEVLQTGKVTIKELVE